MACFEHDTAGLGLQHDGGVVHVVGQIPPVRLVRHTLEAQLVERRELPDARDDPRPVLEVEDSPGLVAHLIFGKALRHRHSFATNVNKSVDFEPLGTM